MKILSTLFILSLFTSTPAIAGPVDYMDNALRSFIIKMLEEPEFKINLDEKIRISFFVTTDNEIVVLKTDSRTKKIDHFIKERLNYHKTRFKEIETNRVYHIRVLFKSN